MRLWSHSDVTAHWSLMGAEAPPLTLRFHGDAKSEDSGRSSETSANGVGNAAHKPGGKM